MGVEAVLRPDDSYIITGFTPFFKEHDSDVVLSLIKSDLFEIMEACANGSFSDDYNEINTSAMSTVSCVLSSRIGNSKVFGLDAEDDRVSISHFGTKRNKYFEYLANKGRTMTITACSSTVSGAKRLMYDTIEDIKFDGKKYRADICAD